jgi:hypothetical protein
VSSSADRKLLSLPGILRWEASRSEAQPLADMLTSAADRIDDLELEAQRLVQELEQARLDAAAERARRIEAEQERNRFRDRLAGKRAN